MLKSAMTIKHGKERTCCVKVQFVYLCENCHFSLIEYAFMSYTLFEKLQASIMLSFSIVFYLVTKMPCTTLPPIAEHMIMNVTSVTFNSILTLSCSEGYELIGDSTMVCGEDGEWNGTKPQCKGKTLHSYIIIFSVTNSFQMNYEVAERSL